MLSKIKAKIIYTCSGNESKSMMISILFIKWFHQCFILEVKKYLEEKQEIKGLLIIDNALGHPYLVCYENKNVGVIFLPLNITSLF
jgi:hypothetical protein